MKITTKTNGYKVGAELEEMIKRFESAVAKLFGSHAIEVEHFYYGDKLEAVMDWQITEPDEYYKTHTDVKPSKYRYCKVEGVIGVPNNTDRTDLVGIVVDV